MQCAIVQGLICAVQCYSLDSALQCIAEMRWTCSVTARESTLWLRCECWEIYLIDVQNYISGLLCIAITVGNMLPGHVTLICYMYSRFAKAGSSGK